jgi:hypothetical protein
LLGFRVHPRASTGKHWRMPSTVVPTAIAATRIPGIRVDTSIPVSPSISLGADGAQRKRRGLADRPNNRS